MTDQVQAVLNEVDQFLNDFADRTFELSQRFLIEEGKNDTGTMFKTANVERSFLKKTIVYPAPYSSVVHDGRLPGSPVYSPWLHNWVRRKLKISNPKEIKSVAFAIAKSIEERGIQPFPFLEMAHRQATAEMVK